MLRVIVGVLETVLYLNVSFVIIPLLFFWLLYNSFSYLVFKLHSVNVYYVMGFRPNYFTCTAHLYLYYTLLVPHTYVSYIRHWCIFSHYEIQYKSFSISNNSNTKILEKRVFRMSIVMPGKYIVCVCIYIYWSIWCPFPTLYLIKRSRFPLKMEDFFFLKSHELSTEHVTLQIDLPFNK